MLAAEEVAKIKAEVEKFEDALRECTDSGIRKLIEDWIADAKKRLEADQDSKPPRAEQKSPPTKVPK